MPVDEAAEHVVAETATGFVRGVWRKDSAAFLGIPFAEPPVGDLRFQAPVPRAPWPGVRDASTYTATPQRKPFAPVTTIPEPSIPGDDTLAVNVFTPRPRPSTADETPLPVLVYFHGGGFIAGSPASPWYDGAAFNRDGIITVTASYRLGVDGFGRLPDVPDNRAVLDWLLALHWVQDNIALFGGDPRRVTIGGQSAGGGAVMTLLSMPAAAGLFAGAISMSGLPTDTAPDVADRTTAEIAARLGVTPDRAGFAGVSELDLIDAQSVDVETPAQLSADEVLTLMRASDGTLALGPVIDGTLHRWSVEDGLRAGAGRDVPLLVGSTAQELGGTMHAHRALFDNRATIDVLTQLGVDSALARRISDTLPGHHAADVVGRHVTDVVFRRRIIDWLALRHGAAPTFVYDFAWPSPVSGVAEHCLDIPFVFDALADPDVARVAGPGAPQSLADHVHRSFVNFIRDLDPGWPAHDDTTRAVMVFDVDSHVVNGGYDSARSLAGPDSG